MEELSIEEKAKHYDEAIERAKRVLLDCTPEEQKVVEYITPELKENNDEKIIESLRKCSDAIAEMQVAWSEKDIADVFEKVGLANIVREQSNDNLTNALQDAMIELSKFIPQPKYAWSEKDEKNN